MKSQKIQTSSGWVASIVIHLIFLWFALITPFSVTAIPQSFSEVSWGPVDESLLQENIPLSSPTSGEAGAAEKIANAENIISLPKRSNINFEEEKIKSHLSAKKESGDLTSVIQTEKKISTSTELNDPIGLTKGKIKGEETGEDISGSGIVTTPYKGGVSEKNNADVGFSIQWSGNFTRNIYNKLLPKFPEKVNQQAQIKIRLTISPNGNVKDAKPLQKGNPLLEQASIRALEQWVFEPLQSSFPQKDQNCVVTFNFVVK